MSDPAIVSSNCHACGGTGHCCECGGEGVITENLMSLIVPEDHKHRAELMALKSDYKRLYAQAEELCRLRPERSASYHAQCDAARTQVVRAAQKLFYKG